ncbi:ATP-binding protein [Sphaerisporangium sp. NPDC088356]|uniref:ATP-binding protein n=1 Tax=Sphaerisporangium sp. NPDC088356 TaxID=3154871 RepID=UPI0034452835
MNGRDTEARPRGRHRRRAPVTQVPPRQWDLAKRASARHLDQMEPVWAVWYGVGARRFYAAATWPAPEPLIVQAHTADELRDLMREAEQATLSRPHPPVHTPPPPRGATMPETPDGPRSVCWDLPHDLSMVGKTRSMVNEILTTWDLQHLADDIVLVTGELIANAIMYGEPPVRLTLSVGNGELHLQVTDHGPEQPRHLDLGLEALHGRGLTIVEALAHASGVTQLPDTPGKTVWAYWRLPSRAAEGPQSIARSLGDPYGQS